MLKKIVQTWWRHQMETFSALLALCAGNSPVPVNSPHKGQWRGALMFSLICARINGWVNNRKAGVLRRYRGHYGVDVMKCPVLHRCLTGTWYLCWHRKVFGKVPFPLTTGVMYKCICDLIELHTPGKAVKRLYSFGSMKHVSSVLRRRPSTWRCCDVNRWVMNNSYEYFVFSAANLALAGFPLTNALGESMPSRH